MLQKKGRKPIGFGSVVICSSDYYKNKAKRKTIKGSKLQYFGYHCTEAGFIVVGGFMSNDKQKYYKVVPIRKANSNYINWANLAIINSKFVSELGIPLGKLFNEHTLKVISDEAIKRFGREFA